MLAGGPAACGAALLGWPGPASPLVGQHWLSHAVQGRHCGTHPCWRLTLLVRDGLLRPKHPSPAVLVQPLDRYGAPLWAARDAADLVGVCR